MANCEYQYPALTVEKKHGDECFLNGCCSAHLVEFWRWAYSDLMGNTVRGKLAEYIVSLAMHCANVVSEGWRAFDVLTPEDIKIEVKTSAYLQSWAQKRISNIRFGIRETLAWDSVTNTYAEIAMLLRNWFILFPNACRILFSPPFVTLNFYLYIYSLQK